MGDPSRLRASRSSRAVILKLGANNPKQPLQRKSLSSLRILYSFISLFLVLSFVLTNVLGFMQLCMMDWLPSKNLIAFWCQLFTSWIQDLQFYSDHLIVYRLVTILNVISLRKMKFRQTVKRVVSPVCKFQTLKGFWSSWYFI